MKKRKCILTVDVEAMSNRAGSNHVNTLIYGRSDKGEYGIGRMMDIADKHGVKMIFFVDLAEYELYGEEILDVCRYIDRRGHEAHVHCHYDLLTKIVGKPPWGENGESYYSWYEDEEISKIMIKYVSDKYREALGKEPTLYRGGEYRFGVGVLKALKEEGYVADCSYNYVRPQILKPNKQFIYENGLMEIPIGILPNRKPLNFNNNSLEPKTKDDFAARLDDYNTIFNGYYDYYGDDAIATLMMHSWSFMHNKENADLTNYFDMPMDVLVDFFDVFLEHFKEKLEFVGSDEISCIAKKNSIKVADFNAAIPMYPHFSPSNMARLKDYTLEKAQGRSIVFWGRGQLESTVNYNYKLCDELDIDFYISNDLSNIRKWRGKPVYKSAEVELNPKDTYVLVLAQPVFYEIRDTLKRLGYKEYNDFFDVCKKVPCKNEEGLKAKREIRCPICGGQEFEAFNGAIIRKCLGCNSLERSRTILKLFDDNLHPDFSTIKMLHVSPTIPEKKLFNKLGVNRVTIDIRPEVKTDIVGDICKMPEVETGSFDMVFASCVLNNVYDDECALKEIRRVLKKSGQAVFYVMDDDDGMKTSYVEDPTVWYGKDIFEKYRVGTYRYYGETDFTKQLNRHFNSVRCYEKYDEVTDLPVKWYVCIKK